MEISAALAGSSRARRRAGKLSPLLAAGPVHRLSLAFYAPQGEATTGDRGDAAAGAERQHLCQWRHRPADPGLRQLHGRRGFEEAGGAPGAWLLRLGPTGLRPPGPGGDKPAAFADRVLASLARSASITRSTTPGADRPRASRSGWAASLSGAARRRRPRSGETAGRRLRPAAAGPPGTASRRAGSGRAGGASGSRSGNRRS